MSPPVRDTTVYALIRDAIARSSMTHRAIARRAGVTESCLSRLMSDKGRGMRMDAAWLVMQALGFEIKKPSDATLRRIAQEAQG